MGIMLDFAADLLAQPVWVPVWVGWLMVVNLAGTLFRPRPEARVVLFVFLASAVMVMALHASYGFARILGLGHVLWIPLLVYLLPRALRAEEPRFRAWLWTLIASNAVSLVLDVRDVWIHFTS